MKKYQPFLHTFFAYGKMTAQKHGSNPCQSVLRASQNQAAALNRRKILRQPCSCRPGMRAHAARDGIRVFIWLSCFLRICRIRSDFPGKIGEENQEPVQGFMVPFLSKLHSGRNIRDIHDRWDRESFHGVSGFPSPYIYIA